MRQAINEEMKLEGEWFRDATKQTPDTLMGFIDHVMNDYIHDYGTVCHAIAACALAAAWAANESDGAHGGITGFQAGFVMWDFIKQWSYRGNKCGLRILNYDNMLYPQYKEKFGKTIPEHVWNALQREARERLMDTDGCHEEVVEHWKSIAEGKVPFGYAVANDACPR